MEQSKSAFGPISGQQQHSGELKELEEPIRRLQRANLPGTLIRLVYETAAQEIKSRKSVRRSSTVDVTSDVTTTRYNVTT